jgi:16S rRNA (cytosine1402-N4)-methyltransferase
MADEVNGLLRLAPGELALDATVGCGGHTALLIRAVSPGGHVIGLDVDPTALAYAGNRLDPQAAAQQVRLDLAQANFSDVAAQVARLAPGRPARAILADLGVSSMQLDDPARGFSFRGDAPLDMRMDPQAPRTAAGLLRELPEAELADLLYRLGGERGARRIARFIVQARESGGPITTTGQLEALVRRALRIRRRVRIHPATRTFLALRLAVNRELPALQAFLEAAPECLAPGGRLIVISFHSGEDRLVKQRFKEWAATGRFRLVQRSVARPGAEEVRRNPRSRSARLRALERL